MDYNLLILKEITGQTSAAEKSILQEWLIQAQANRELFNDIKQIWQEAEPDSNTLSNAEFGQELKKLETSVHRSIQNEIQINAVKRVSFLKSIAICILSLFSVLLFATNYFGDASPSPLTVLRHPNSTTLLLSDSSQIILDDYTKVALIESQDARNIDVNGQALLKVRKGSKAMNFNLGTTRISIDSSEVLINNRPETAFSLFVISGKPRLTYDDKTILSTAGEEIRYDLVHDSLLRLHYYDPNIIAWYTRQLDFKAIPLREVLAKVSIIYGVQFATESEKFMDCRFSGSFNHASIDSVLKTLSYSMDVEFVRLRANHYSISGPGCVP